MYIYFIFVASLVVMAEGCGPPPCHWTDPSQIENYYNNVVNIMIAADQKIKNYCEQKSNPAMKEDHSPKKYRLIYPNAEADNYEIKVKNRALLVRAENCLDSIADVRILPPYVEPRGASYSVDSGDLVITFRYKFDPITGGGVCVPPDPTVFNIPKAYT